MYQRTKPDPRPFPESSVNNYYGKTRLFNPIPNKIGIINQKVVDWGFPDRRPPPSGLRHSREYFKYFFERYFPDVECKLVVSSVLNNETAQPVFHFPSDMSKQEIVNYLSHIYGIDNVAHVATRNVKGRRYKNEVGAIKTFPDFKEAVVTLDTPVKIDFKLVKGTEDAAENMIGKK
jgi:large subunit ribosomal protein L23